VEGAWELEPQPQPVTANPNRSKNTEQAITGLAAQGTTNRGGGILFRSDFLPHKAIGTIPMITANKGVAPLLGDSPHSPTVCATASVCNVTISVIGGLGVAFTFTEAGCTEQTVAEIVEGQVSVIVPMKPGLGCRITVKVAVCPGLTEAVAPLSPAVS